MTINEIRLGRLCPEVFAGKDGRSSVEASDIWGKDVRFTKGSRYLVEAASGMGKSSLCSYIFGARTDYRGDLCFNGEDTRRYDIEKWCDIRRQNIAYLPQDAGLFPEISVMENIRLKASLTGAKDNERIMEMLDFLDIAWKADSPARLLSIGQQQRVAIVRTLCQPFDFLLVDEPVSHLDEINNRRAAELIDREAKALEAGVIVTSVGNRLALPDMTVMRL